MTYNYGVKEYEHGNDFQCIEIHAAEVVARAVASGAEVDAAANCVWATSPGGYRFKLVDAAPASPDPVRGIALHVSDLVASLGECCGC